ncbi:WXG100 family type VII secretion target [Mycolicibacterium pulveris]|uniref:WXG100 family type VII secretion target n=1 Tax=Mycolicibacterium pulveris TaxID=36813 RepID=UPI003CF68446
MRELRVDPSEVHGSGVEIGEIAATVNSEFTDSDTAIASAQSGWTGTSAGALASMVAEWQQTTRVLGEILVGHADKFTAAAKQYGQVDESAADSVRGAGENL